jgi:hypothetical protein
MFIFVHFHSHLLLSCLFIFHFVCNQVLIFSQWSKVLDIMDYYLSEKGLEVCRIDGSVSLDERKRQVCSLPSLIRIQSCFYYVFSWILVFGNCQILALLI